MPVFNERPEGNLKKMGGGIENYILSFLLKKILNIVKLKSKGPVPNNALIKSKSYHTPNIV